MTLYSCVSFLVGVCYLLGKRGFEDGERLCDTFHNLFGCFCVVETEQHGFPDVSPPGSQTAQRLLQLIALSAQEEQRSVEEPRVYRTFPPILRRLTLPSDCLSCCPLRPPPLRRRHRKGRGDMDWVEVGATGSRSWTSWSHPSSTWPASRPERRVSWR